jgi:hypothetical protein
VKVVGLHKDGAPASPITEVGQHDNDNLRRWTLDDVRAELRAGRVVIRQIKYRFLPGPANSAYGGDHFMVITGMSATASSSTTRSTVTARLRPPDLGRRAGARHGARERAEGGVRRRPARRARRC